MRYLGYTRVSTSSQDAQLQLDALVAARVQKPDVFADVTSGSKAAAERPGMKKMLANAEPGDTVVVWRVDRLGRSLIDVLNTVNLLRDRDVQVRSVSDGIDPATSTGRLMLNMLAADARAKAGRPRTQPGWSAGAARPCTATRRQARPAWTALCRVAGRQLEQRPMVDAYSSGGPFASLE